MRIPTAWALVLLALAACGESAAVGPPPPMRTGPRFPESPRTETLVPSPPWVFEQETWTLHNRQHCWEWGFPEDQRDAQIAAVRSRAERLGWYDVTATTAFRREGTVISLAPGFRPDTLDPAATLLKVSICTERIGSEDDARAFVRTFVREPLWTRLPLRQPPDVTWRRQYTGGTRAIGVHWPDQDVERIAATLRDDNYVERERNGSTLELRRGRSRARFLGSGLWWQTDDQPE